MTRWVARPTVRFGVVDVSVCDLREHGGDLVERVRRGERIIITQSGRRVAQLVAIRERSVSLAALIERRRHLPPVDPAVLLTDCDSVVDASFG